LEIVTQGRTLPFRGGYFAERVCFC
jgi:hypothetical protein